MISNRLAFAAVSVACVAAAAGGGYLATRQSQASSAIAAPAPQTTAPAAASVTPAQPAAETAAAPAAPSAPQTTPSNTPSVKRASVSDRSTPAPKPGKTPVAVTARNAAPQGLDRNSPAINPAPQDPPAPLPAPLPEPAPAARQDDVRPPEPLRTPEPEKAPEKSFDELVVAADSVIGLQLETALSTEKAHVEDRVDARVIRDVRVRNEVAVPAGAHAIGSVMVVESGGKFKDKARIGIRFNTLVMPDGTRLAISTETIYRSGEPPGNAAAAKVGGGAVIGTILGGLLGGAKGAAVGAAAGAGGGAAAVASGDRSAVTLPAGTQLTARFLSPVAVTVER
jgi:hypothetical protein